LEYKEFLRKKAILAGNFGFEVNESDLNVNLFPFQKYVVAWALKKGRGAIFADTGLGKTLMQLDFAQKIVEKTNKPVLILTPLAVSYQTIKEAERFGIEATRSVDGKIKSKITVTNYERIHYFNRDDFGGCVADESAVIKNEKSEMRKKLTEFMRYMKYRLLCTATAAPNDYPELGTSSEALGMLGFDDMIGNFFKSSDATHHPKWNGKRYTLKPHAEKDFWRWVCSWAIALRKPSDLGFSDDGYNLPPLEIKETVIDEHVIFDGEMFPREAIGWEEQRVVRKKLWKERCEVAAEKMINQECSVGWGAYDYETDALTKMVPGAVQVKGSMRDEEKEEKLMAFSAGEIKKLVTKPSIAAHGLNWQHCGHMAFFPTFSFEEYYQAVRRFWRYGRVGKVEVDLVTTSGEGRMLSSLNRKAKAAEKMFEMLVKQMKNELYLKPDFGEFTNKTQKPSWL